ncbi:hypothetical protein AGMMS49960_21680 [Betaproteobacteria bacterium]|nr:hypothetical protein AGMMS49543_28370 [Betaproteobacteria bacterium]GHU05305.1 hypothetical protein AGMMS49960_21680 [Betaproteobacteria bacterium]
MLNRLKTFDVSFWLLPLLLIWALLATQPLGAKTAEKSSNESSGWNAGVALSFGNQPTITSQLRLPGQYEDEETGLHYNFRRYYEPETGRYITSDPIGVEGRINLYQYAGSDPVNLADPTGEVAFIPFMIAAGEMYARCYAPCMIVGTTINYATGACEEPPWKDCAKECLNPFNWGGRKAGKRGVRAAKGGTNAATTAGKSVDDILSGTTPGRATKGKTTQYIKQGSYDQVVKDFDSLNPLNVRDINTNYDQGKTGTLPDGKAVTVRPGSTDGRPTLEIRGSNGRGIEIRYGE